MKYELKHTMDVIVCFKYVLTGCSNANHHWCEIKGPCGRNDEHSYITTEKHTEVNNTDNGGMMTRRWTVTKKSEILAYKELHSRTL